MKSPLRFAAPMALAGLVFALSACGGKQADEAEHEPVADGTTAAGAQSAEPGAPAVAGIEGLDTERKQVSYMIGLDLANSLMPIKDDLDVDVLAQAMSSRFAGEPPRLSEEQVRIVQEAYTAKLQARQAAEFEAKAARNLEEGKSFLEANKDRRGVRVTESGLQYRVERAGSGPRPSPEDVVRVHYRGTLLDGTQFDSSYERGEPAEFGLGQVIPGWAEGVALMPVGSKYTFWIPASLAYGETGTGPIPPNATLSFEVELLDIVK
ncbi:FKBP-type peptidyl-prolyl cis-trans isomerase [Arenimonas fontis]|uniref:Peptidyl-prolyl cis-trans isomerase n=1 Tax=Arenimonas fontis TaxID=2608255 RepID=A0A5B2ZFX8_9GAMM|nr:FKBP-type peptidyl-prolyl cis-trans isomerase [Arenimonas fontis]KAA2286114.1 FKBP-type peptidyl-prolyl cis-trans isomerase [Arenimonas fontis]